MKTLNEFEENYIIAAENASGENNLRFSADKIRYSWLPGIHKNNTLILNRDNYFYEHTEDKKYEYIILDEVLGQIVYEGRYATEQDVLQYFKTLLLPNGKLVVLAQNLMATQSLCGMPTEDGKYLNDLLRKKAKQPRKEYLKNELETAIQQAGFSCVKFFYPYPNNEYVKEIFTDDYLEKFQYGKPYYNTKRGKVCLYDEEKMYDAFKIEGVLDSFVNAFCIVATKEEESDIGDICYVKLNADRDIKYQIGTIITKKDVFKYPLTPEASSHITMLEGANKHMVADGVSMLQGEKVDNGIRYPLLLSDNLDTILLEQIEKNNIEKLLEIFCGFYSKLLDDAEITDSYNTEAFRCVFGEVQAGMKYHCVAPMNVDLIADNVFFENNEIKVIDGEWIFPFKIPVEFVIWRAINELFSKHVQLRNIVDADVLYSVYGIDNKDIEQFENWGKHFAYEYVKSDQISKYAKNEIQFSLNEYVHQYLISSSLIIDNGDEASADEHIQGTLEENFQEIVLGFDIVDIEENSLLKWKPFSDIAFRFTVEEIQGACIAKHNAYVVEGQCYTFLLGDACLWLKPDASGKILIKGRIQHLNSQEQRIIFENVNGKMDAELLGLQMENDRLKKDLDSITNSTIWRKTEIFRKIKDRRL